MSPMMEGTARLKTWQGEYDFAKDGGAGGTIVLRSNDGPLPPGAVVELGFVDVLTGLTTATAAQGALTVEAANDIVTAAVVSGAPWSSTGRKSIIPAATGLTTVKATVARAPSFVISVGTVTAGKFTLTLHYK